MVVNMPCPSRHALALDLDHAAEPCFYSFFVPSFLSLTCFQRFFLLLPNARLVVPDRCLRSPVPANKRRGNARRKKRCVGIRGCVMYDKRKCSLQGNLKQQKLQDPGSSRELGVRQGSFHSLSQTTVCGVAVCEEGAYAMLAAPCFSSSSFSNMVSSSHLVALAHCEST